MYLSENMYNKTIFNLKNTLNKKQSIFTLLYEQNQE